jgi:predicted acyltransferase
MTTNTNQKRLLSIDTLRGFDMLLIAGGGTFLVLLEGKTGSGFIDVIANQLHHVPWHGFAFYDFIMPLFLFISGVSLSFSLTKGKSMGLTKPQLYKKVFIRMLILIGLGMIYKNSPIPFFDLSAIRFGSVLGRIGIACFATAILFLNFSWKTRLLFVGGILLCYYAALFLIPVPGFGAGDLSMEGNLVGWFDRTFLPGRLLDGGIYDELGLLTQFPALCITVFGSIAGDILRRDDSGDKKTIVLVIGGLAAIALSLLWNMHFPINKKLWSSSFILLTSGLGFLILALFYWVIDVKGYKKWTFFFKVIGMNSLTVYYAYHFVDFSKMSQMLIGGLYAPLSEEWQPVIQALGALALVWLFLYFLYKKGIFIKI